MNTQYPAGSTFGAPVGSTFTTGDTSQTTAHSLTVHGREEKHLEKEIAKEAKRASKEDRKADKLSGKAEKEFNKAASKAEGHGLFSGEKSSMKHEEKAVKLAAAANLHRQAATESHSEVLRADTLNSLPVRGTLPGSAQHVVPL